MKILLSAYACEPHKGSEPGVGWNWALELERLGHEVWVITRKNNEPNISKFWKLNEKPSNLNFIYYDVPRSISWWKRGGKGVYLYYLMWQLGAFFKARLAHKVLGFECVQHITFVTVRQPSFMGFLGVPFILGPIGGGERAPRRLRKIFSFRARWKEFARDLANSFVKFDPLMHATFSRAQTILATSLETRNVIPALYRDKVQLSLAIGVNGLPKREGKLNKKSAPHELKVLYVGRFECWKGMDIGLEAFAQFSAQCQGVTLTIIGEGPDGERWRKRAKSLGVEDKVTWVHWLPQHELYDLFRGHDVFLFPSLHDSGGMVVLEALSNGLPVLCMNTGGPGQIVDESCGVKVDLCGNDISTVVGGLVAGLWEMTNPDVRERMSKAAVLRANHFRWSNLVKNIHGESTCRRHGCSPIIENHHRFT